MSDSQSKVDPMRDVQWTNKLLSHLGSVQAKERRALPGPASAIGRALGNVIPNKVVNDAVGKMTSDWVR